MRVRRLVIGSVAALALVGGGGAVALEVKDNIQNQQQCSAMKARHGGSFAPVSVAGAGGKVAIIGDSYTEGYLLDQPTKGWAYKVASGEGWNAIVDGVGSTGFLNESACGSDAFSARTSVMEGAKTVVIQGGINDFKKEPGKVAEAAQSLVNAAPRGAQVVVIGPAVTPARPQAKDIDAALKMSLAGTRAKYISTAGWNLSYLPDGVHMTEGGHETFAKNVMAALK